MKIARLDDAVSETGPDTFAVLQPRRPEVEYHVAHSGESFFILTNEDAFNFRVFEVSAKKPDRAKWREIIPHRPNVKIDAVETDDQIVNNQSVAVKKVKFICDAVDVNGGGIENPNAHLTCYLLKAPKLSPRPSLQVSTQFQVSQFQAKKGKLLCLPSTLDVLP